MWKCGDCKCERAKPEARLPQGWKRRGLAVYCATCWRKLFVLRAVTIPVVSPLSCSWDDFGSRLRLQWQLVTQASNWIMTELYARDDRSRDKGKLQPMPRVYLYPETRRMFPSIPSPTAVALENAIGKKYRAKRFDVVWACRASLPTFRYPTPFPVPNERWSVRLEDDCPIVSARIADERIEFRLRSGHQFHRQMAAVKQIITGEAKQGEMALYRQGKSVMCKMVAWLPRVTDASQRDGVLYVRTAAEVRWLSR